MDEFKSLNPYKTTELSLNAHDTNVLFSAVANHVQDVGAKLKSNSIPEDSIDGAVHVVVTCATILNKILESKENENGVLRVESDTHDPEEVFKKLCYLFEAHGQHEQKQKVVQAYHEMTGNKLPDNVIDIRELLNERI